MLGLNLWDLIGMRCRSPWKALEQCSDARRSSGRAERYACVAPPQGFSFEHPRITPPIWDGARSPSARAAIAQCRPTSSWIQMSN